MRWRCGAPRPPKWVPGTMVGPCSCRACRSPALAMLCPSSAEVVSENNGWSVFLPGLPIAADGATLDEAIDETVLALREYAEDWQDRLRNAPNHRENWGLVQLVSLSTDAQLRDWLVGARE